MVSTFYGLTAADYDLIKEYEGFEEFEEYFTIREFANGVFYEFSGNDWEFNDFLFELLEDEGIELERGMDSFSYILSTNSVIGF